MRHPGETPWVLSSNSPMQNPAYIAKNRHGTFYFRTVIPTSLRDAFPDHKREIKKSLQTNNRRVAITKARLLRVEFDQLFDALREGVIMGKKSNPNIIEFFTITTKKNLDGSVEEIVRLENQTPEDQESLRLYLKEKNTQKSNITSDKSILISELIEEYAKKKVQAGEWQEDPKSNAHQQGRVRLNLILQILGDKQTKDWTVEDSIKMEETIPLVPKNMNNGELGKLASFEEKIKTSPKNHARLDKRTQSKYWQIYVSLVQFAHKKMYLSSDITANCIGISYKKREGKKAQWIGFTDKELQNIFDGHIYQKEKLSRTAGHSYHFWLPLLGAYTGARINELCQLLISDVKQSKEGVWYIDITDEEESERIVKSKSLKTEAAKRRVPIHSKLLELGFIDFLNEPRFGANKEMVFSTGLKYETKSNWGKNASRWFNGDASSPGYKQHVGFKTNTRKVFHSFRKSFATNLNRNIRPDRLSAMIGHEQEFKTTYIYVDEYQLSDIKEAIECLNYDIDLSHVSYQHFIKKYER